MFASLCRRDRWKVSDDDRGTLYQYGFFASGGVGGPAEAFGQVEIAAQACEILEAILEKLERWLERRWH